MRLPKLLSVLLLTASCTTLGILACRKSDSSPFSNEATVSTSFRGRIVDENRNPVSGATVTAGGGSASTNVNGEFILRNVSVSAKTAFVKVEKDGYFTGSRTLAVTAGREQYISIELAPRRVVGTFSAGSGGTVSLGAGGTLQFAANGVVLDGSSSPYTGTVRVAAHTYDPTAANFNDVMPGALVARNSANEERILRSYGMANIELLGSGGEKLQLAPGKTATLILAIPPALQGTAPASIPMWYFDESKGIWIEEGSGHKQGNVYVGTVSHFTPWNYDVPESFVLFQTTVLAGGTMMSGSPIDRAQVTLTANNVTGTWYTDNQGVVQMRVPVNQALDMKIYDRCGVLVHSASVGPYALNTNPSTTTTVSQYSAPSQAVFQGNVINCNGQPVTNGFVQVVINGTTQRTGITNGAFSFPYSFCGTAITAQLIPVDLSVNLQGPAQTVTAQPGSSSNTPLTACGPASEEFVQFVFNNSTVRLQPPADSLIGWSYAASQATHIYAFPNMGSALQPHNLGMELAGPLAAGAQTVRNFVLTHNYLTYEMAPGSVSAQTSSYGAVNGFITGSFNGSVRDSLGLNSYPVSGSFKVRRGN